VVNALKALAKELNVPVILLCQLNRATELHGDKRPNLTNLRSSGEIEQSADLVLFVHRPEYYKDPDWQEQNVGELIIGKNRNGRCDAVKFRHASNMSKVYDY
jgi:replicative DNA helicase